MDTKDYTGAAKIGAKWLTRFGLKEIGYPWLSAYVGLASVVYDYFEWFVEKVDEANFNRQIAYYITYRKPPNEGGWGCTHEEIIASGCGDGFDSNGFLFYPSGPQLGSPTLAGKFKPENVFKVGKATYDSLQANKYKEQDETAIKNAFIQALNSKVSPIARFTISPKDVDNPSFTVTFDASSSEVKEGRTIQKYLWVIEPLNFREGVKITHAFDFPGIFNVKLTVYDSANYSSTIEKKIYVTSRNIANQPPIADFTYQIDLVDPFTINFDASVSRDPDGNIIQYRWSFSDAVISFEKKPSHKYGEKGTYNVELRVTDNNLHTSIVTKLLTVSGTLITPAWPMFQHDTQHTERS